MVLFLNKIKNRRLPAHDNHHNFTPKKMSFTIWRPSAFQASHASLMFLAPEHLPKPPLYKGNPARPLPEQPLSPKLLLPPEIKQPPLPAPLLPPMKFIPIFGPTHVADKRDNFRNDSKRQNCLSTFAPTLNVKTASLGQTNRVAKRDNSTVTTRHPSGAPNTSRRRDS